MELYTISPTLNKSRVFILQKSELEKRFDPFFYVPELLELEKKVLAKKPKKLRDYVQGLASGATPKTTESEKYYAEKENGIPFLRVQNLSPTGVLEFDDCKYINEETHNGMLKRSQVSAGDLLVKITGVGRMAVASVAPDGFEGNINQHVCVIKTGSKEISETLAAFLNSDIGEKLASRRSTGGTRPALDYPALLSIPIIENKRILQITDKVIAQKQRNEAEAEKLLSSIDDYLLKELGIKLPEPPENTLKNRIFVSNISELSGSRFDPHFNKIFFKEVFNSFSNGKFSISRIKDVLDNIKTGTTPHQKLDPFTDSEGVVFLRNTNLKKYHIDLSDTKYVKTEFAKELTYSVKGEVIMCIAGTVGLSAINDVEKPISINQNVSALKFDDFKINPDFASYWFNTKIFLELTKRACSVATIFYLNNDNLKLLPIPVPPFDKQKEIAEHITGIRQKAQQLKDKTTELLKKASEEIEEILLF
jgi:restriction endonuclease S subunit